MPITAVLGEQRGDEGKGRFTDMVAAEHDIVARFNGGPNAGHTVVFDGVELDLHSMPSGIAHPGVINVIGNGALIDPVKLVFEIEEAERKGLEISTRNFMISSAAHLILPQHIMLDTAREAGPDKQGTTGSGIAPTFADKAMRVGKRMEIVKNDLSELERVLVSSNNDFMSNDVIHMKKQTDAYLRAAQRLGPFVTDISLFLRRKLDQGARVLAEGAQAFLLDIDQGMYPAVSSSSTTVGGIFTGLGVPAHHLEQVIGVSKAIPSHVGGGPFLTEIHDRALLKHLRGKRSAVDGEYGTTTKRPRRLGHLDLAGIKRAQGVNGTHEMALTKLDKVGEYGARVLVCVGYERKGKYLDEAPDAAYKIEQSTPVYEDLPTWTEDITGARKMSDLPYNARQYLDLIENTTGVQITRIGVGPRRDQVILRD